jgi:hypothetical protein
LAREAQHVGPFPGDNPNYWGSASALSREIKQKWEEMFQPPVHPVERRVADGSSRLCRQRKKCSWM